MPDISELKEKYKREFRRIYYEPEIRLLKIIIVDEGTAIIYAHFPEDGSFYFVVQEHMISCSYDSLEEAQRSIR